MMKQESETLAAIDKVVVEATQKRVNRHDPLSPALIAEDILKLGIEPVTKPEFKQLEADDVPRKNGCAHMTAHAAPKAKPAWHESLHVDAGKIAEGAAARSRSLQAFEQEFAANRKAGFNTSMTSASRQVEIVRAIMNRVADAIEAASGELSDFHGSALARLLLQDKKELSLVHAAQAKTLRMFASKIKPTPHFNWKQTLADFGITTSK